MNSKRKKKKFKQTPVQFTPCTCPLPKQKKKINQLCP